MVQVKDSPHLQIYLPCSVIPHIILLYIVLIGTMTLIPSDGLPSGRSTGAYSNVEYLQLVYAIPLCCLSVYGVNKTEKFKGGPEPKSDAAS